MKKRKLFVFIVFIVVCAFTLLIIRQFRGNAVSEIKAKGKLVVITRNAPTTYYEGPEGPTGFEYMLVSDFAEHLGVKLELIVKDTIAEILEAMDRGEADIAAAAITRTDDRRQVYLFGPDYHTVQQQVVCRRGTKAPEKIEDLVNYNILIIAGSSYEEQLNELKKDLPALKWETTDELSTEQILEKIWKKEVDCTIADSNIVSINRRYYPEIIVAFPLYEEESLAWVLRKDGYDLQSELEDWLDDYEDTGRLAALRDHFYGYTDMFNYVDIKTYHRRIKNRLPVYKAYFKKSGKKYNLPWTLIAAQAYQESHWDASAKSATGVRGIMMLTKNTAKSLHVNDRLDPEQSIFGGAKYLSKMMKRIPVSVTDDEDRLKFALAAYNVGMGHIHDARALTEKLGKNPDIWQDVKEVLPLLSQKKYYKKLKYGYARGSEPVRYVTAIYNFRDILEKNNK